jgi:hypothetical protein
MMVGQYAANADVLVGMDVMTDQVIGNVITNDDGAQAGYPGVQGQGESHVTFEGTPGELVTGDVYQWRGGSDTLFADPAIDGGPGRVSRLAFDSKGPAYSESVCSHEMAGARVKPGWSDLNKGGPVGAADMAAYQAVALAQGTANFPSEDLAQLSILLGI